MTYTKLLILKDFFLVQYLSDVKKTFKIHKLQFYS